jgi:hypothetical protein
MADATTLTLHCANHPDRETMLRCNRCDKPICYQCAVRTPVGYRCKECVRTQQNVYYNGGRGDLVIAGVIALALGGILGGLAYAFLGLIGFFSFIVAFFAGPAAGGAVAEVVRRAVKKRRTRGMKWLAAVLFLLGLLAAGILLQGFPRLFVRWDVLLFAGLGASTIYARLL